MNRGLEAITWALEARGISPTAFRVLTQLCKRVCGDDRRHDFDVWPSQALLAEECEISVSGVKRHLQELEDTKYITKMPTQRHDGSKSVNRYTLMVRTRHVMPDGRRIDAKGEVSQVITPIGQSDLSIGQSERGHRSGVNHAQASAGLCNEPSKRTSEIEETPLSYGEDTPTGEIDLFGKAQVVIDETPLADRVLTEWNAMAKRHPGIAAVRVLDETKRKQIATCAAKAKAVEPDPWKVWQQIFKAIESSTYLCGEDPPGKNYTDPFRLKMSFVLRPTEFLNIFDGGYRANRSAETHNAITGERFGPAEQAGREKIASIRAARGQRGEGIDDRGREAADGSGNNGPRRPSSAFDRYRIDAVG